MKYSKLNKIIRMKITAPEVNFREGKKKMKLVTGFT